MVATAARGRQTVPGLLRVRLLLTRLVLRWGERRSEEPLLPGQAATLAASLARLLDRVATEGASFAKIAERLGYATCETPETGAREIFAALRKGTLTDGPTTRTVEWYKNHVVL